MSGVFLVLSLIINNNFKLLPVLPAPIRAHSAPARILPKSGLEVAAGDLGGRPVEIFAEGAETLVVRRFGLVGDGTRRHLLQ